MCYQERLFSSWARSKDKKRAEQPPVTRREQPELTPRRPAPTPEPTRRKESERELEEIV